MVSDWFNLCFRGFEHSYTASGYVKRQMCLFNTMGKRCGKIFPRFQKIQKEIEFFSTNYDVNILLARFKKVWQRLAGYRRRTCRQ